MAINEPEDGKSYGIAAVANWVDEDDFPLSRGDLEEFSDRRVMLAYDRSVRLGKVLEHVEGEEFGDLVELWGALGDGFREVDEVLSRRYLE